MDRELKRQIKQDEVASGISRAWDWAQARREPLRKALLVVVVLVAVAGGLFSVRASQSRRAERAFAAALELYQAPAQSEMPPGTPLGAQSQPTAADRYRKALAAFDAVQKDFGSLPAGRRARYFAALCRMELGELDPARQALTEIAADHPEGLESALARLALAELEGRAGQVDKAVQTYRALADDPALAIPRDQALLGMASLLEDAHRDAEAAASYRRLADEFPDSPYATDARRRAQYLSGSAS